MISHAYYRAISKKTATETLKHAEEASSKTQVRGKVKTKGGYYRLIKTIYDMISFLSGKSLPGIPANVSLPTNPVDRVRQIYWQHCTLLTFLRYLVCQQCLLILHKINSSYTLFPFFTFVVLFVHNINKLASN